MFSMVYRILQVSEGELLFALMNGKNTDELKNIKTYLDDNFKEGEPTNTGFWARIVDDNYYSELNPEKHGFVSTVLAKVIELSTNNVGIWDSYWAKQVANRHDIAKTYGEMLYTEFCEKIDLTEGSSLMKKIYKKHSKTSHTSRSKSPMKAKNAIPSMKEIKKSMDVAKDESSSSSESSGEDD